MPPLRQNGLTVAEDIRAVSATKLHEIFGANAVLYLDITEYGSKYLIISSDTCVTASTKLVDLKTGKQLWSGSATTSSKEQNNSFNGIIGALVQALVEQVINTTTDRSHSIANITSNRLLCWWE